jgi:hypothetical protein
MPCRRYVNDTLMSGRPEVAKPLSKGTLEVRVVLQVVLHAGGTPVVLRLELLS